MAIFDGIRRKFALTKIKQDAEHVLRNKQVFNLDDAKTVGIAFHFTTNEDFDLLKKYVLYLRELKKKVKVVGYYEGKVAPSVQYSKVDYDFVNEKSFTWWGKSTDHIVHNFIEEPYDIYIDLNFSDSIALKHIAYNSAASFKIGLYKEDDESPFDMLISVGRDAGWKAFLREVDTYLQKINKPTKE